VTHADLFPRLSEPGSDVVVVTPNRRLARSLGHAFDAWQVARGLRVWETPRILPLPAFTASLYDLAQHDPALAGVRAPLAPAQEQVLWESVIEAGGPALAAPGAAAQLAADAWSLAHQWRIAERLGHFALTQDTRVFAAWAADYARRVESIGATDQARLPDAVRALVSDGRLVTPKEVALVGFDDTTHQQQAVFDALAAKGTRVVRIAAGTARGACVRVATADPRDELERMADWVANRLVADPAASIGIVVPDLAARRRAIARALDAALTPDQLLAAPDRSRPYSVSLGDSLVERPLVATALRVLRLAAGAVDFEDASAVLRSSHLALGPAAACATVDAEWRRRAARRASLEHLAFAARNASRHDAAVVADSLDALLAWRRAVGTRRRGYSEWTGLLSEALRTAGFPGPRALDSFEYQAFVRWQELLGELAALDRVDGATDLDGVVRRIGRLAASTAFQPEGGDPPVRVLGLLEANGLEFDHLWIAGMTSEGWPLPARPHPLLPLELQRAARMPGALVEVETQRARAMLDRLACSAREVVASHALRDGDRTLAPAAMIEDWPAVPAAPRARRVLDAMTASPLDVRPDATAPPLHADRAVGGGTAILTDQSACAFRAFARHRLAASEPELPCDGLAPSERGELVHRVLARFWESLPVRTRSHVAAMPPDARASLLERAADEALARMRARRDGLGDRLLAIEKQRLVGLVPRWLEFEIETRVEFEVRSTEERRALAIGPLSLRGQLDRVDVLPDGRTIVIDYKTGGPSSAKAWLGERPDEPQLPLYVVASEPDARAIAFARLRAGELRFVSLAEEPGMLPGDRPDEWRREHGAWPALVESWRTELTRLAGEFASGVATVSPKRADSCRYCGVMPLCRLGERVGEAGGEGPNGEVGDE